MFIVESYSWAVAMCIITMLCWGSWANTQKLASKEWRFELFYWDYAIGVMLLALVLAFTLGNTGGGGRSFLADLRQADVKWLGSAFLGGVIFNLSNILLVAAIDVAGLAVAFPVGVGLALALGVVTTYVSKPEGNVPMLAAGVGAVMIAIVLDAVAYKRLASGNQKTPAKGIVLSVVAGLLMGFFYSFVAQAMGRIDPASKVLEAGKLSPYTAIVLFSAGLLVSNFLWNSIMMVRPLPGEPVAAGRLLQQRQRPLARDRDPGRRDLERRHEFQHHSLDGRGPGVFLWSGQGPRWSAPSGAFLSGRSSIRRRGGRIRCWPPCSPSTYSVWEF